MQKLSKWMSYETPYRDFKELLKQYIISLSLPYEISKNGKRFHFEIKVNNEELKALNTWMYDNI